MSFRTFQSDRLLESIRNDVKQVERRAKVLSEQLNNQAAKITNKHVEEIHDGVLGLHERVQVVDETQQNILDLVNYALASQDGLTKMLSDAVESKNRTYLDSSERSQAYRE